MYLALKKRVAGRRFLAPPEPPEEDVVCVVSHQELVALHAALRGRAPSEGAVVVTGDAAEKLTVDLGLRRLAQPSQPAPFLTSLIQ